MSHTGKTLRLPHDPDHRPLLPEPAQVLSMAGLALVAGICKAVYSGIGEQKI